MYLLIAGFQSCIVYIYDCFCVCGSNIDCCGHPFWTLNYWLCNLTFDERSTV